MSSLVNLLFGRDVDDSPVDTEIVARNERMIQFYLLLYSLLLTTNKSFDSYFIYSFIFSVLYYLLITRTVGVPDEKNTKLFFWVIMQK